MKKEKQQIIFNIIRDFGILLGDENRTSTRHSAIKNIKKNFEILDIKNLDL